MEREGIKSKKMTSLLNEIENSIKGSTPIYHFFTQLTNRMIYNN